MVRRGVTLFQLITVLALLSLLAAFLLPALAKVRQAAARSQSSNNLKQIALAVHNYESANAVLPPGNNKEHFSAHAHLLPYIEQDNLYKLIDFKKASDDDGNSKVRAAYIKTYLSPRDPVNSVIDGAAPHNYLFCAGSEASLDKNNGMFYLDSKLSLVKIPDGTSNTIMAVETLKGDGGKKAMNVQRQHVQLKAGDLKGIKDTAGADDWKDNKNIAGTRCASWIDGRFLQGTFTGTRAINDDKPDVDCGGAGGLSAPRSLDANYILVAFGDGSVRTVSKTVKFNTWQNLCNTSDGNVIDFNF